METGLLVALGLALALIVIAVLLSLATRRKRRDPHDLNGSDADNRANATWIGIRQASGDDIDPTP